MNGKGTVSSRPSGRSNKLSAGFDYNYVSFYYRNNRPFGGSSVTDLDNSTPGQFINVAGTVPRYQTYTNQMAFFAEDQFALSAKVSLVGGLRVDRTAVERLNLVDNTTAKRTFTPPNWRGGVVYSVTPGLSVYGQVATASDTLDNVISSGASQLVFDPTTGRQVAAGVKQSLPGQRGEWTFAAYHIVKEKLVVPVPGVSGVSQQVGSQSSRGVEVTAMVNLPAGLRIDGNLAVLDARYDDFAEETVGGTLVSRAGNTPPSVPERAANLWITWSAPRAWQFRTGLRSVGRRYWDSANTTTIPAYTVVDAGIRKRLSGKVAIDLHLFNLTDKLYGTDVYFNGDAPQWMLGAPRSAEVLERLPVAHCRAIEQDVGGPQRPGERKPFERAAARQCHVRLPMGEGPTPKVDVHLVQRQALALVDGERPRQPQRELPEGARDRLDDLLLRLVVSIAAVLPGDALEFVLIAVDLDPYSVFLQARHAGDGAVDPAPVGVVAQEHDLGAGLQHHGCVGGLCAFVELAGHAGLVLARHSG
jgi:hypothetical protein